MIIRFFQTAALIYMILLVSAAAAVPDRGSSDLSGVTATPGIIREIQFMLLSIGLDPGPIDGNAGQLTNRAARLFQQRYGLPEADIINNQAIPTSFLERLRREAAASLLKGARPESGAPASAATAPQAPPSPGASPGPPPGPPPSPPSGPPRDEAGASAATSAPSASDRFAACPYSPQDFLIGTRQYTPQTLLDEGFEGMTSRAVTNLRKRLEEARQVAEKIGGPALLEVQRQARVLSYFECREKIEQRATTLR